MLTPSPSRSGPSQWRRRRWLSGAVTLLAAFATVVSLSLQVPAASASVARAAAPGHAAAPSHAAAASHALAASVAAALAHSHPGRRAAPMQRPAPKLKPVIRTAVRHDTSPPLRKLKPLKKAVRNKLKALPLRSPPHAVHPSTKRRTADIQGSQIVATNDMPS